MRIVHLSILMIMGSYQLAEAQSFAGIYTTPTSNGLITLTLSHDGPVNVTGTLVGDDGITFRVLGTTQGTEVQGSLANATGNVAAIQGGLNVNGISFYLIPVDANGQPNYASAQEFVMERQSGTAASDHSGASPLSGLGMVGVQPDAGGALSGSYHGDISGTPAILTLDRRGDSFGGAIDAGDYSYTLRGTAGGSTGKGTLVDPQANASMEFEIAEQGGTVTVTVLVTDPNTGQAQRIPFEFRRDTAGNGGYPPNTLGPNATGAGAGMPGKNASIQRDPALVGSWAYSDTYVSNGVNNNFSATTRYFMQISPDGSYAYGSGGMSAGLDNDLGSVQGNSGPGDVARGQWRTEGDIVFIMEAGSPQWVPYARYYVEGSSLLFTYENGKRQRWRRQ